LRLNDLLIGVSADLDDSLVVIVSRVGHAQDVLARRN
jgi:hypothetical protein